MNYLPEESKVVYGFKDGKDERVFDALEWLGSMGSHGLDNEKQTVSFKPTFQQATFWICRKTKRHYLFNILEGGGTDYGAIHLQRRLMQTQCRV
jgi:hypothetical protein